MGHRTTIVVVWGNRRDLLDRGEVVVDTWEEGLDLATVIRGRGPYDAEVMELNP